MELFTNLFRCCRETRKIPSAKDIFVMSSTSEINPIKVCENQKQDENCNVNNIVKSNNEFYVLEVNSGVMMDNLIIENNYYDEAYKIYKDAIRDLFYM